MALRDRWRQAISRTAVTSPDCAPSYRAEVIVDAATSPSPEEQTATEFFVTAAPNLQRAGVRVARPEVGLWVPGM